MERVYPTFVALTLNSSPTLGEGLPIWLPFSLFGRRGWGMRANLQHWDAPNEAGRAIAPPPPSHLKLHRRP